MKIDLFKKNQFRIRTQFKCKYSLIAEKTFLFQAIQFSWLVGFYGISNFVGYLTPSPFLCK